MVVLGNLAFAVYFYKVGADDLSADWQYLWLEIKCSDPVKILSLNGGCCTVK